VKKKFKNHLSLAHQPKYSPYILGLVVVSLALIGYFVVHQSHAANADINGDGSVNILDLSILAANYGKTGRTFAQGDINGDGTVSILDLSILAANWGSSGGDTTKPTVSLTAPTAGATLSGTTTLTATASDNVGVAKVEFFSGATLLNTDTTSPYSYSWDTTTVTNGTYSLTAEAFDAAGNTQTSTAVSVTVNNTVSSGSWWKPSSAHSISWNWVIGNPPNSPYKSVNVYDIDGFDNPASTVTTMHSQGKIVICYIDVGTYEPGRSDDNLIPTADQGSGVQGWPGEKWLNIADISGLTPVVQDRMNLCKSKGFDAIEPDNIDGYTNSTGFPLTANQQLAYNEFLATTAHNLGLSIGLKNDTDQTTQLQPYFDWALDEECNNYSECNTMAPFTSAGKAVFNAEYTDDGETTSKFCAADATAHINGVLFSINLDDSTFQACSQTW